MWRKGREKLKRRERGNIKENVNKGKTEHRISQFLGPLVIVLSGFKSHASFLSYIL